MYFSACLVALSLTANVQPVDEKKYSSSAQTEIDVVADPLLDELSGTLKDAVKAFTEGEFEKAEIQFSKLANKQLQTALNQHFNRQFAPDILGMPVQRSAPYTLEKLDVEALPQLSAPNASVRSNSYLVSGPRLRASASKLYYLRGLAQSRQNKTKEAKRSFERAILLHKNNVDARMDLAILAIKNGDHKTSSRQLARLERTFSRDCAKDKCPYGTESRDRYSKLKQVFEAKAF